MANSKISLVGGEIAVSYQDGVQGNSNIIKAYRNGKTITVSGVFTSNGSSVITFTPLPYCQALRDGTGNVIRCQDDGTLIQEWIAPNQNNAMGVISGPSLASGRRYGFSFSYVAD